ncbi:hypothetical protein TNCV_704461 [Trichonephila clavipes]|nr:hypothetical protein TNCV_704461 [Trichonephila clavipes]
MTMTNARCQCSFTTIPPNTDATSCCCKQNLNSSENRRHVIRVPRFVVDHTFEDAPVNDAAARVAEALISELRVHVAANVPPF